MSLVIETEVIKNVRAKLQIHTASGFANEPISDEDITKAIQNAVKRFSIDRPQKAAKDYVGNGQDKYHLPSDWDDFSSVENIVFRGERAPYPSSYYKVEKRLDQTQYPVVNISSGAVSVTFSTVSYAVFFADDDPIEIVVDDIVQERNWASADGNGTTGILTLLNATGAAYTSSPKIRKSVCLHFLSISPSSQNIFRIEYNKGHTVSPETSTIPDNEQDAFEHLAASLTAIALAAKYANVQEPSMEVDAIDYGGKSSAWLAIAEKEMQLYNDHLNIGDEAESQGNGILKSLNQSYMPGYGTLYPNYLTR